MLGWALAPAGHTRAAEVVLTLQFPLPLLPRHHGVVVAVVVQDLLPGQDGADAGDDGQAAVVVPHHVGVAGVVDQRESPEAGGSNLTLDAVLDTAGRDLNLGYLVSVAGKVLQMSQEYPAN